MACHLLADRRNYAFSFGNTLHKNFFCSDFSVDYLVMSSVSSSMALSFILALIHIQLMSMSDAMSGSVVLDSITFDKMIRKFKTSLVKFDIQYPFGEKHEEFEKVVKIATNSDLLMAEVGVKVFGDKENVDLIERFGITNDDFPVMKLFIDGAVDKPIHFDSEFKSDSIIRFIRRHSSIRIPLSSSLEAFDKLSERFMAEDIAEEERTAILSDAKRLSSQLTNEEHKKWSDIYVKIMEKVLQKGIEFIDGERQRLETIITEKLAQNKRNQLLERLNILLSFPTNDLKSQKSEL